MCCSHSRVQILLVLLALFSAATLRGQESKSSIDYQRDIVPILAQNCTACHNAKEAEGGLNLESFDALMKGGDTGASIVPKNATESYLMNRITGQEEPIMPPEDNSVGAKPLNDSQIELLKTWIAQGALNSAKKAIALDWHELPESVHPVYALDASPDAQHVAFGHGNKAIVATSNFAEPQTTTLIDPSLPQPTAHRDLVQAIAFSPDSQRLATGGFRTVKLWRKTVPFANLLKGLAIANFQSVSVSPDRTHLAYASGATGVEIVHLESGKATRFLKAHTQPILLTLWISDSQLLTHDASTWQLVDISAQNIESIELNLRAKKAIQIGNDTLLLSDDGRLLKLLSSESTFEAEEIQSLENLTDLQDVCPSKDGEVLAVTKSNSRVHLFEWSTKKEIAGFQLDAKSKESITAVSKSGLLSRAGNSLKLWDVQEKKTVATLNKDYYGVQKSQRATRNSARQLALIERLKKQIPELEKASSKEEEAKKKVQEARDASAKKLAEIEKEVSASEAEIAKANAAIEAAKKALADAEKALTDKKKNADAVLVKKNTAAEDLAKKEQALAAAADSAQRAAAAIPKIKEEISAEEKAHADLVVTEKKVAQEETISTNALAASMSPDGSTIFVAHSDGRIHCFSSTSGQPTGIVETSIAHSCILDLQSDRMLCLSADGQANTMNYAANWELERTIGSFTDSPFSDRVTALDFSPDGRRLAVGSGPPSRFGDLTLVNADEGQVEYAFGQVHSDTVFGISFSADGRFLASCGADKLARVFNLETHEQVRGFEGHTHHVLGVSWSDDSQQLATASADKSIKIWNVSTGEPSRTIGGFGKEVTAVRFSGQTSKLISSSADGTVRLHDANNGKQLKSYGGASNALFTIGLTDNDERVMAAGQTGTVWAWQIGDGKLLGSIDP